MRRPARIEGDGKGFELAPCLEELVKVLRRDGLEVYVPEMHLKKGEYLSWLYFTDGVRIGYAQEDGLLKVLQYSTIHVPNKGSGGGFVVEGIDPEEYENAFVIPEWGRKYHVQKWKNWDDYAENGTLWELTKLPMEEEECRLE